MRALGLPGLEARPSQREGDWTEASSDFATESSAALTLNQDITAELKRRTDDTKKMTNVIGEKICIPS